MASEERGARSVETAWRGAWAAAVAMVVVGCGGGVKPLPAPSPTPEAPPTRAPAPTAAGGDVGRGGGSPSDAVLGRFAYAVGTQRYEVRSDATVELAGSRERETIATSARVIYTVARGTRAGTTTMTGAVDSIATRASARVTGGAADAQGAVIPFRATVDGSARATAATGVRVELVDGAPRCAQSEGGGESAALTAARETVVRVPASIPVGARWRDSVVTPSCSGEVPTVVTTVARYEVVGRARYGGVEGVRVRREVATTTRGQGIARGRLVAVVGSGSGEGSVYLDPVAGRLLGVEGETRGTVRVTVGREGAPGGRQEFTQGTKVRVRLLQ